MSQNAVDIIILLVSKPMHIKIQARAHDMSTHDSNRQAENHPPKGAFVLRVNDDVTSP